MCYVVNSHFTLPTGQAPSQTARLDNGLLTTPCGCYKNTNLGSFFGGLLVAMRGAELGCKDPLRRLEVLAPLCRSTTSSPTSSCFLPEYSGHRFRRVGRTVTISLGSMRWFLLHKRHSFALLLQTAQILVLTIFLFQVAHMPKRPEILQTSPLSASSDRTLQLPPSAIGHSCHCASWFSRVAQLLPLGTLLTVECWHSAWFQLQKPFLNAKLGIQVTRWIQKRRAAPLFHCC